MRFSSTVALLAIGVSSVSADASDATKCSLETPCKGVENINENDFVNGDEYIVYSTSKAGDRLSKTNHVFSSTSNSAWQEIKITPSTTHQTMAGFGGALTDAASIAVNSLESEELQNQLINLYYGEEGIEYSIGRVPIASCDFSTGVYSYAEETNDYELNGFSIDVDKTETSGYKLPFIQRVLKMSVNPIQLFASPWAPPAWMTTTNSTTGNPVLRDEPEVYKSWALYFAKFLEAYRNEGVNFWGITTQNEPMGNTGAWQDLKFSAESMAAFIGDYLGPLLREKEPELKIMMMDDQRTHLKDWSTTVLNSNAAKYVDGIGLHWYAEVDDFFTWATKPFEKMEQCNTDYPEVFMLATEACNGYIPVLDRGPKLGDWTRGERYGYDIMSDINAYAVGWTDWNIALDLTGGPNWAKNVVDSPVLVDTVNKDNFFLNPMYYYLGHFSKFIRPGSKRLEVKSTAPFAVAPMEATAFKTQQDLIVVVVMNRDIAGHSYNIQVDGYEGKFINVDCDAHSIQTIVFKG